ncbi:MAG: hypothetical protein U0796_22915 [Gemmatales bacterium]
MTCQEVNEWLLTHRPQQATAECHAPQDVLDHVGQCASCQQEQQLDAFLRRAMHQVEPSPDLAGNILWQLRQRRRSQQRAQTLYWSMAAAAAFFLAICLHWYVQQPYDLSQLSQKVAALEFKQPIASLVLEQPLPQAQLVQWFSRQGVSISIPKRLKLEHLTGLYVVESGGRKVAVLELRAGGSVSKVCLLERRFFNTRTQRDMFDENLASFVIADSDDAETLGWMIVDKSSAHLFVEGTLPVGGA